jgi:hypothetical protein
MCATTIHHLNLMQVAADSAQESSGELFCLKLATVLVICRMILTAHWLTPNNIQLTPIMIYMLTPCIEITTVCSFDRWRNSIACISPSLESLIWVS